MNNTTTNTLITRDDFDIDKKANLPCPPWSLLQAGKDRKKVRVYWREDDTDMSIDGYLHGYTTDGSLLLSHKRNARFPETYRVENGIKPEAIGDGFMLARWDGLADWCLLLADEINVIDSDTHTATMDCVRIGSPQRVVETVNLFVDDKLVVAYVRDKGMLIESVVAYHHLPEFILNAVALEVDNSFKHNTVPYLMQEFIYSGKSDKVADLEKQLADKDKECEKLRAICLKQAEDAANPSIIKSRTFDTDKYNEVCLEKERYKQLYEELLEAQGDDDAEGEDTVWDDKDDPAAVETSINRQADITSMNRKAGD